MAGDFAGCPRRDIRLPDMVYRYRIAAIIRQIDPGAGDLRHAGDDLADPPFHHFPHFAVQGTDGALQLSGLRDYVAGVSGVKFAHRNDSRFQRIDTARHDRLQRRDQLRAYQDGIDAFVRTRGVAAEPLDLDDDGIASGHDRTGPKRERADRNARTVMHAVDLLDTETVRQRVHIRPQPDHLHVTVAGGPVALDDADDAGAADTGSNLVAAEFPKAVRHQCRSAVHIVEQFRVFMNIPSPGLDIGLQLGDAVDDGHGDNRLSWLNASAL